MDAPPYKTFTMLGLTPCMNKRYPPIDRVSDGLPGIRQQPAKYPTCRWRPAG